MSNRHLVFPVKAVVTRLNALIAQQGLGTPTDPENDGFAAQWASDHPLCVTNGVLEMCWWPEDDRGISLAQWGEMCCFVLSQMPTGCPLDHHHLELPDAWRV